MSFCLNTSNTSYSNNNNTVISLKTDTITYHIAASNTDSSPRNILALNLVLHYAANADDPEVCRALISANADPNSMDENGKTALTIAVQSRQWFTAKALIDNGAAVNSDNREILTKYLDSENVQKQYQSIFFTPFPNPEMLEIFINNSFKPFSEGLFSGVTNNALGVALFNISDEPPSADYGAMGGEFSQDLKFQKKNFANYKLLNKYGMVVIRSRVDSSEKLSTIIDKVEDALPKLPILFWGLNCHGCWSEMFVGKDSKLDFNNIGMLAGDISSKLDSACKIALISCSTAERQINNVKVDLNIATLFSYYAGHRQVYASSQSVTQMTLNMYSMPPSPIPQFVAFFKNENASHQLNVVAYQNGMCIVDENKHRKNAIKQCMLASIQTFQVADDNDSDSDEMDPIEVKRLAGTNSWTTYTDEFDPFKDLYYQGVESFCDYLSDSEDDSDSEQNLWNNL